MKNGGCVIAPSCNVTGFQGAYIMFFPVCFHLHPVCAAGTCDIHILGAGIYELYDFMRSKTGPCFFHNNGNWGARTKSPYTLNNAVKVSISLRLYQFLPGIQVNGKGIYFESFEN